MDRCAGDKENSDPIEGKIFLSRRNDSHPLKIVSFHGRGQIHLLFQTDYSYETNYNYIEKYPNIKTIPLWPTREIIDKGL